MADLNFSLDEYIARKSITSPPSSGGRGGRGGTARGGGGVGTVRGGGASRGGARPAVMARLGSRQPPPTQDAVVQPLMKIGLDARDKLIEKARQGDARDRIIMKNRNKYKDAREKIGHPPQPPPAEEQSHPHPHPHHLNGRNGTARPPIVGAERFPPHRPPTDQLMPPEVYPEDDLPRRRADARIIGHENNIIVMAKNDFSTGEPEDIYHKPHQSLRHGNPVVMIRNDRVRNNPPPPEEEPPVQQRQRAPAPPLKAKIASPRRGEAPIQRRQQPPVAQRKQVGRCKMLGRMTCGNGFFSSARGQLTISFIYYCLG